MNTLNEEPTEVFVDYLGMVHEFHETFDIPSRAAPCLLDEKSFKRRIKLITEELGEYCSAVANNAIVEIADALADLLYVIFGTCLEHGLPMNKIFRLVHESNMTKIGGHKDKSGKWIKPPTYTPVDLRFLEEMISNDNIKLIEGAKNECQEGNAPQE